MRRSYLSVKLFSSETHDKADPFRVRRSRADLGELDKLVTSVENY